METTELQSNDGALTVLINESGIDLTEAETIKQSYLPFFEQMAQVKEAAKKIDFVNPTELDETIARELRLKTVKIRTGSEALKDERKRGHMLKGNLEQSAWNLIRDSCKLDEDTFLNVEKAREIKAQQERENRKQDRLAALMPYGVDTQFIDLLNMDDESFQMTLANWKLAYDTKLELERKAEEDRILREKAVAIHNERKEKILPFWNFVPADKRDMDFSTLTEDEWNERFDYSVKEKDKYDAEQIISKLHSERLASVVDDWAHFPELFKKSNLGELHLDQWNVLLEETKKASAEAEEAYQIGLLHTARKESIQNDWQFFPDELKNESLGLFTEQRWAELLDITNTFKKTHDDKQAILKKKVKEAELNEIAKKKEADAILKAERLAKEAPDKEKLKLLVVQIGAIKLPDVQSEFAILIIEELSLQIDQIILSLNQSIKLIK